MFRKKNVNNIKPLAQREKEVFDCLVKGMKTSEIATKFDLKPNTISTIKKTIYRKLNLNNPYDLFQYALIIKFQNH
jgi:DNA-binding NarL/FixJ family response regulator